MSLYSILIQSTLILHKEHLGKSIGTATVEAQTIVATFGKQTGVCRFILQEHIWDSVAFTKGWPSIRPVGRGGSLGSQEPFPNAWEVHLFIPTIAHSP